MTIFYGYRKSQGNRPDSFLQYKIIQEYIRFCKFHRSLMDFYNRSRCYMKDPDIFLHVFSGAISSINGIELGLLRKASLSLNGEEQK